MLSALPNKILTRLNHYHISPMIKLEELDIRPNDRILEVGLPLGFFAPSALKRVGAGGSVYVAGPSYEMLSKLNHLRQNASLHVTLLADVMSGKSLPEGSVDTILLTNILSKSVQPEKLCIALGKYMKAESEIVLVDWDTKNSHVGPILEQRASREEAIKCLNGCGLVFKRLLNTPGYHYGLVFGLRK